jgi:hypothetical protein
MQAPPQSRLDFLDFLVEMGVISPSLCEALKSRTRDEWIPLGKILRQQGHLTMGQLMELLQLQAREPHTLIGDLAVREGQCTREDIVEALRIQFDASPHPVDLLLQDKACDHDRLLTALATYVRRLESRLEPVDQPH